MTPRNDPRTPRSDARSMGPNDLSSTASATSAPTTRACSETTLLRRCGPSPSARRLRLPRRRWMGETGTRAPAPRGRGVRPLVSRREYGYHVRVFPGDPIHPRDDAVACLIEQENAIIPSRGAAGLRRDSYRRSARCLAVASARAPIRPRGRIQRVRIRECPIRSPAPPAMMGECGDRERDS